MRHLLAAVLVIGWSVSASAQEAKPVPSKVFVLTAVSLAGLGALDAKQSIGCLSASSRCYERSPLLSRTSPAGFVALKAVAVGAVIGSAWSWRKTHPKAAYGLLIGMTGLQAYAVIHNAQVLR